ncbi:MAG: bifunctional 4-hydroxy-2-oxoglutarate aldolase/2-dehydro-3-deoxy-phosphogluconate aldolase [Bacteroidota bacterium]
MTRQQFPLADSLPVIGILRGYTALEVQHIMQCYETAGFRHIEVTLNTEGALDMIRTARQQHPQLHIGAGTVRTLPELQAAIDAGAQYAVTPILDETVIDYALQHNFPILPGAYTPTEVYRAWNMGVPAVKLFPAVTGGLTHVKAILGPLDDIKLVPTGGVDEQNIRSFLAAGVYMVGMGSGLFPKAVIAAADWTGLTQHLENLEETIRS